MNLFVGVVGELQGVLVGVAGNADNRILIQSTGVLQADSGIVDHRTVSTSGEEGQEVTAVGLVCGNLSAAVGGVGVVGVNKQALCGLNAVNQIRLDLVQELCGCGTCGTDLSQSAASDALLVMPFCGCNYFASS